MIKHFGRWIIAVLITLAVAGWLLYRAVGPTTFTRILLTLTIAGPVVSMLLKERQRGTRPGGLSIIITLVAAAAYGWILFVLDARWWVKGLLLVVMATPLMSLANRGYRADVLRAQKRRDLRATHLAQAVQVGQPVEPFALYLRPFVSTDRLMAQALPSDLDMSEVPVHLDVETLLARCYRTTVPMIALGKSGDTMEGAARVTVSDANWRETVEALAHQAEFIAMVPLSRPGTMWELEWLKRSGRLSKILFIMPETPHETPDGVVRMTEDDRIFDAGVRRFEASEHMLDLHKEWLEVEAVARSLGLEFPPLAAVGALYTMDPRTGAVNDIVPLALSTLARRVRYLRTSVMRLGLLPASTAQVDFLQDFVKAAVWGGRTLEFALVRAGDGFAVWGDAITATRLIQRAVEAGQPYPEFARSYMQGLPELIEERVKAGDVRAAMRYAEFARKARTDSMLASLTTKRTFRRIESLLETLGDRRPELRRPAGNGSMQNDVVQGQNGAAVSG